MIVKVTEVQTMVIATRVLCTGNDGVVSRQLLTHSTHQRPAYYEVFNSQRQSSECLRTVLTHFKKPENHVIARYSWRLQIQNIT